MLDNMISATILKREKGGVFMKKIISLFLLSFVAACSSAPVYDKEFKNPLFNQPLRPLGKTSVYTYLTPTSVDFRTPLDKNKVDSKGKCDLIENKEDRITLKCAVEWSGGKKTTLYLTYIIKELFSDTCLRVLELSYNNLKDYPKTELFSSKYCITPPDKLPLESD